MTSQQAMRAADAALSFQPDYAAALLMRGRALLALHRSERGRSRARARREPQSAPRVPVDAGRRAAAPGSRVRGGLGRAAAARTWARQRIRERSRSFWRPAASTSSRHSSLTERELTVRRDVFTEDAHAWALASARRFDEAAAAMERALSAHTNDARLFLHAGVIAASTGRRADSRRWLAQADRLRSTLLPSELEILRNHRWLLKRATRNHTGE